MPSIKKATALFSTVIMMLLLNACALKKIKEQTTALNNFAQISGQATAIDENSSPVVVAILTYDHEKVDIINQNQVDGNGNYQFNLLPGEYLVGAYIDDNNNHIHEQEESSAMHTEQNERFTKITLTKNEKLILPPIKIHKDKNINAQRKLIYNTSKVDANIGRVISLDDPMFSRKNSTMGLWRPFDFGKQVGGGLLFLQDYDANKTPVLFVHGLSGSPSEFKTIIEQLDKDKFQPWVLYYPSGLPLEFVNDYLLSSLIELQRKHGFEHFQLISHSMGGLITRTFLREHEKANTKFKVSLYVTINSPFYGIKSAASGVKSSPIVVASWRDLATGSDYIKAANRWTIPKSLPFHLFFSYLPGEDCDGNVSMSSQLSLSLQNEAVRIYGSQASHTGILTKPDFIERLTKIMISPLL
jgi:uncharacterized alpha/beta hydrolase family protein